MWQPSSIAPLQPRGVRAEDAAAIRLVPKRDVAGAEPMPDGGAFSAELDGDAADRLATGTQRGRLLITGLPARERSMARPFRRDRPMRGRSRSQQWLGCRAYVGRNLILDTTDSRSAPADETLHGIAEVAQRVPAVSDLDNSRRTLPEPVCLYTGPVARDHLDTGLPTPPSRRYVALPVAQQQVDHGVALQVNQHRAIAMAATPRPVSTPSTRGVAGPPRHAAVHAIRRSVSGLVGTANRCARRAPASPPSARLRQRCNPSSRWSDAPRP